MNEAKIFVDLNIFINMTENNAEFFERSSSLVKDFSNRNEVGIITPYILNELHYFFLKKNGQKIAFDLCKDIMNMKRVILVDLELSSSDVVDILRLAKKYNLKTFDAYHAYFCKKLGIKKIATFDKDFEKINYRELTHAVCCNARFASFILDLTVGVSHSHYKLLLL